MKNHEILYCLCSGQCYFMGQFSKQVVFILIGLVFSVGVLFQFSHEIERVLVLNIGNVTTNISVESCNFKVQNC